MMLIRVENVFLLEVEESGKIATISNSLKKEINVFLSYLTIT